MAPEMISKQGYNFTLDYYCLGILVYELILGHPPFLAVDKKTLYNNIVTKDLYLPGHLSPHLRSFLTKILTKNSVHRLGAKEGLSEIINHPWCQNINYAKLILKKFKSPIVPNAYKLNFDEEFIKSPYNNIDDEEAFKISDNTIKSINEDHQDYLYGRFANFSFYSNIEDLTPQQKFSDSILHSPKDFKAINTSQNQHNEEVFNVILGHTVNVVLLILYLFCIRKHQ